MKLGRIKIVGKILKLVLYYVLSALLCLIMKLFVKHFFLHFLEDIGSIKKMNWVKLVLSYLMHEIEEFKTNKQSDISGCLLFFYYYYYLW